MVQRKKIWMETNQTNDFLASMARRAAAWGLVITGFLGLILAINAALINAYIGAGVCLVASALGFGVIGHTFARK